MTVRHKAIDFSRTVWRAFVRLTRFLLSVAMCSLPLWLIYALILSVIEITRGGISASAWPRGVDASGCGILFTLLASVGIRYLELPRRLTPLWYALRVFWVFIISTVWWNVTQLVLGLTGLS